VNGARDISKFGGWRAFMAEAAAVWGSDNLQVRHGGKNQPWRTWSFVALDLFA